MTSLPDLGSWEDLAPRQPTPDERAAARTLPLAYAHAFATGAGARVLADLRARTVEATLPPWVAAGETGRPTTEAELRSLEGQRLLVRYIENQVRRGQEE